MATNSSDSGSPFCRIKRQFLAGGGALLGLSVVPWTVRRAWAARPFIPHVALEDIEGSRRKQFSEDPETGAHTRYMEIAANWQGGGVAHYHTFSEEVYVLSGDVTLNGRDYLVEGSYLYRPGGIVHGHQEGSIRGCRLILKFGGPMDSNYIDEPESNEEYVQVPSDDGRPHIVHLETPGMEWQQHGDGQARYGTKVLSEDRKTGASTMLIRFPAGWRGRLELDSAATWEWFVIKGQAVLEDGTTFETDSYSLRPVAGRRNAFVGAKAESEILLWRDQ
ncbi:MAG: DUF4437 domain-containing protein [Gammaproteobacteria bacterium]